MFASFRDQVEGDPNLKGVTSLAELHARLRELSLALVASDEESRGLPFWESTDVGASDDGAWDLVKGCLFAV